MIAHRPWKEGLWIAYLLRQLTKSNILWFLLDLWPLKILAPTWSQLYFSEMQAAVLRYTKWSENTWVLVGASNSGHSMIAYLLRQLTKSNILWFVLDLWPLKILAPTWTQIYFFKNASSSTEINEVKSLWVLVGAASSKHIKSAYRTAWTFIWPLHYCALVLRKCLENY